MNESINKPRRKQIGCYTWIGCILFLSVLISASLDLTAQSALNQADQLWRAGEQAKAVSIYSQKLGYVGRDRKSDISQRITLFQREN